MKKCPYCKSKEVREAKVEGDTLIQCLYCGYTIENGIVTRKSNIVNILKVKEVLDAQEAINQNIYSEGMDKDDLPFEEYVKLISDYLEEEKK